MRRVCITVLAAIAIAMTAAACSKDPQKAKVEYFESGNRYFDQKKYQEAVVEYRNAIQQDPKYGEARYKLAETYAKLDDARNAYREYIRAADLLPANAEAQLRAGTLLLLAGQYRRRAHPRRQGARHSSRSTSRPRCCAPTRSPA